MAENERANVRKRQIKKNKIIKDKRVHLGRPKYKLLDNSEDIIHKFHNKKITNVEAAKILNMTMGTFLIFTII